MNDVNSIMRVVSHAYREPLALSVYSKLVLFFDVKLFFGEVDLCFELAHFLSVPALP